jgi:predicted murein hydrolase (TIGR00659 family)
VSVEAEATLAAAEAWMGAHRPLAAIGLTLLGYAIGHALWERGGRHPLLNPTLLAIALVSGALMLIGADYGRYFEDARLVHLLLGPAVVALAVPLYRHLPALRARAGALALALAAGSSTAIVSVLAIGGLLGAGDATLVSLAPKSATTAVSMAVAAETGGIPALTAVVTIMAGITGALAAGPVLRLMGVTDPIARGFGMGVASHGIATARAFQESEATGTAAGLGMGLNAVLTALLVPLVLALWL